MWEFDGTDAIKKMGRPRNLSPEDKVKRARAIKGLIDRGYSKSQIANCFGVCYNTIVNWLKVLWLEDSQYTRLSRPK